ncbi:tight adherence protein C [Albidovulum inexpectatum]|uniref:Tight adherence protein C n=1 Tax=Albidovulum inexpectatum TaxID=196587 RepID=A0A2S5JGM3_9RHOB|nr:type II secretion system F family protein [Albidovulum inexpectatum]PPB80623.1 tight adherence protein C [Albidovulum inexpectatum]
MLSALNEYLVNLLGPLGPLYAVAILGVLMIGVTLPVILKKRADPWDKLRETARPAGATKTQSSQPRATLRSSRKNDKLEKFASFLEPKTEEELSTARLKMLRAGYRGRDAVRKFHAIQFILGISFLVVGVIFGLISSASGDVSTTQLALYVLVPGLVGYFLPRYWVERRIQTRQQEMQNAFPDALDMLLVCVEAGQSLDQALMRVSKELKVGYPTLAEELEIVAQETKAGKDRISVLRAFSERVGIPDISSFVTVMIQSQTFGTSIADALRVYSAEMRDKRVMRAEEIANKLPTKMTLGTMMFTVPPLLVILVGPSVYDMMQVFANFRP